MALSGAPLSSSSSSSSSSYSYYYYSEEGEEEGGSGWAWGNGSGWDWVGRCGWAPSDWAASFWLLPALYLLVFGLGLAGNGLVLATACCPSSSSWDGGGGGGGSGCRRRWPSEAYLAHLALADLAFVVTLPLWAAYTALGFHWPFGAALCKLSSYLVLLNMFASAFCLAALSLERYLAIVRHAWPSPSAVPAASSSSSSASSPSPGRRRGAGGGAALAAVWLGAALLALPALLLRETRASGPEGDGEEEDEAPLLACDLDLSGVASSPEEEAYWLAGLSLASTALGFLLPLLLMSLCYLAIGAAVSRHFRGEARARRRRRARLLRILASLVLVFAGCWLPFHLLKSLYVLAGLGLLELPCGALALLLRLHPYATCLAYLNSCLNPLLYAALDPRFRRRGRRLFQGLLGARPPRLHPRRRPGGSTSSGGGGGGGSGGSSPRRGPGPGCLRRARDPGEGATAFATVGEHQGPASLSSSLSGGASPKAQQAPSRGTAL